MYVIGFSQVLAPRCFTEQAHFCLLPRLPVPFLRYLMVFICAPWLALWLIVRHGVSILVAQSPYEGGAAALAKVAARMLGRRVALVVESHSDFEATIFLQRRVLWPWFYRQLMRATAGFACRQADVLRVVSHATRVQLQRWAPDRPVVQFPTWTDIEAFLHAGTMATPRQPYLLYVGVLTPLKGVCDLVAAFSWLVEEFPEARLTILGRRVNRTYAAGLEAQVARLGLGGRVRFVGEMPQRDLANWMRQASVVVLPSLSEGLPRVILEAMATGTPVIGTTVGGIPELIQDGVTGLLCPPGDVPALAERLRWVLKHPQEAEEMGARARQVAQAFYSTAAYVDGYRAVFSEAENAVAAVQPGH